MLRLVGATCFVVAALVVQERGFAQTAPTLKVMDWNIHHGVDTSGANNLDRVVDWIIRVNPHVVSLNEVERQNGYNSNADEPGVLESRLESRTGAAWYGCFAQRTGASTGQGNLLLSRIPIESCSNYLLSASRSVARARITLGGVVVHVFSTHIDDASASTRTTQVNQLTTWAAQAAEQRVIMGDFNASASSTELQPMRSGYADAWAAAVAAGTATAYPGNDAGNTRNSRIDYIWRSRGATQLQLQAAQVYDTGSVSDHRPLSATFSLNGVPSLTAPQPPTNVRIFVR